MNASRCSLMSSCSSISTTAPIDYVQNLRNLLQEIEGQISKDGDSQLKRLISCIDNPERVRNKPMKSVSLGELNTVDLCFLTVALVERRVVSLCEETDALKEALKNAVRRIAQLEHRCNRLDRKLNKTSTTS